MKFYIDITHLLVYYNPLNGFIMDNDQEISTIFRELSLENQERLLDNARLSRIAENAVKRGLYAQDGAASGRDCDPGVSRRKPTDEGPKNR
jgi:hypothetical protein